MKQSYRPTLLIILAIAVASFSAGSQVLAFSDGCVPESELPISTEIGPYTVILTSIRALDLESCPSSMDDPCYQWNYNIENTVSGDSLTALGFFAMLIPDCCSDDSIAIQDNGFGGGFQTFPVAQGESTLNFGRFIEQAYVIKGKADSKTQWSFITNTNTLTMTTALIKYGKGNAKVASAEIPGPGCTVSCEPAPPPVRVEPVTQCYQFIAENQEGCPNGVKSTWLAKWNAADPCAVLVYAAYGGDVTCETVENEANLIDPEPLEDIKIEVDGAFMTLSEYRVNNFQCHTGWFQFVDDTGCNTRCYTSGGRRYCL